MSVQPVVASFADSPSAERAAMALREAGLGEDNFWLLIPPDVDWARLRTLPRQPTEVAVATDCGRVLVEAGLADGPARFDEREFTAGKSLVLLLPDSRWPNASALLVHDVPPHI